MRLTHRQVLAVVTFLSAACSGNEATPAGSTGPGNETRLILTLSAQTDTIPESTSKTFTARVTDQTGLVKPASVSWSSTAPNIASVANGVVTGVSQGVASIIASTTGAADTARIVVIANDITLDVQPSAAEVAMGDTINFVATMRTRSGDVVRVNSFTWTASDTAAASFVSAGTLRTKREGEVSVTAEAMARQGNSTVKIFRTPVASVTISPSTANVYKGATTSLVVTLRDHNGRLVEDDVTWGSSNYSIATVTSDGRVTGVGVGTVVITATADSKTGSATINVMSPPAASVSLSVPSTTLLVGGEMQATATPTDASGEPLAGKTIAYQSANPSIATVTSSGVVKGIAEGAVTLSAIVDGVVASSKIAVKGGKATSITVSPNSPTVSTGQQSQLAAQVLDENGVPMTGQVIAWASSNPVIATVSGSGLLQGVSTGTATITATSSGLTASVTASVVNATVASVRVSPTSMSLVAGRQGTLTAEALDQNQNVLPGRTVSWSSQNPTIATVTNAGVVTAIASGSTTLTATIEGKTGTAPVTVSAAPLAPVASVTVSLVSATLNPGQQTQATATLKDAQGNTLTGRSITWYSLDSAVAKVSTTGTITAVAGGTVAIMASSEGKSGSASLTVTTPTAAPVAKIGIDVPTQDLTVGQSIQAVITLYDASGNVLSGRTITYASENSSVITVSASGVIKGVSGGATRMKVTSGSITATETFYVTSTSTVASISVTPSSSTLSVGQTTQATAVAKDAQGATLSNTSFTWTTSNSAVATVTGSGVVSAVGAGSATIHAAASGVTGSMAVSVTSTAPSTAVASVTVSLSASAIAVGGTSQATAVARNASGSALTGKTVSWSVGGSQLASVNSSGLVTALLAGTVPVTATVDGIAGSASLTITAPLSPPAPSAVVELPRTYLNFSYPPKTGQTIFVPAGGNLQTALNNAQRGDEIVLAAGATFTGNFVLPVKSGTVSSGWIVIRGEQSSQLPPIGTRVTPSYASQMPKIVTPNVSAAIRASGATSGWWLVGLEVTVSPAVTAHQYGILTLGDLGSGQSSLANVPSDIVLDRMYVHAQTTTYTSRCVALNSARTQVTDSYITECHGKGFDSQAIWGANGPGPYKIVNNYLAGAGENIMFGGADPSIPGLVPADIEIRRNFVHTPYSWYKVWERKNLLELKNATRVLIEGNVFDGVWADAQAGWAIVFMAANQSGACRWCRATDITFRRNLVRNAGSGIDIAGRINTDSTTARILIQDVVLDSIGRGPYGTGSDRRALMILRDSKAVTFDRTLITGNSLASVLWVEGGAPLTVTTNVWVPGQYGIMGSGYTGAGALNFYAPGYSWSNNTVLSSSGTGWPSGTSFISSEGSVPLAAQIRAAVNSAIAGVTP